MRAIVITESGGPEVLRTQKVADPVPAEDEMLIRVAFEEIAEAHRVMEAGQAACKLVVAGA